MQREELPESHADSADSFAAFSDRGVCFTADPLWVAQLPCRLCDDGSDGDPESGSELAAVHP